MADGPPGIRRIFARDRDNLDNLFRRKGGRRARARVSSQSLHEHRGQCFIAQSFRFHLCQLWG